MQATKPISLDLLFTCFQVEASDTLNIIFYLLSYSYLFCTLYISAISRKVLFNYL
jgi:hypothetical protein